MRARTAKKRTLNMVVRNPAQAADTRYVSGPTRQARLRVNAPSEEQKPESRCPSPIPPLSLKREYSRPHEP